MKSTIGRKIAFAFFVMLILMGALVGITFQGFNKIISSLDNMELEAVKRGAAGNLRFSIAQLLMASNDYIITEKDFYQREYNRLSSRVDDFYEQFIQLHLTEEEEQLLAGIKQDLDSVRAISTKIFSIQHPRQSPKAWALMETMDYRYGADVNLKTTQIFDGISRRIEQQRLQAAANKTNALNSVYEITFLGILITLVVGHLTVQRISKPILTVSKAANSIANGDYSQRPVVKTHDEVAVLAESFSRMAESIQQSQRALEESKWLTESIVATVPSGLLVFGSNGKILSVNNGFCNIFGLVREVLIDKHVEPVLKELGISEECCSHILARDPVRDVECTYTDPTKGTRMLSMTLFPLRLTDGESLLVMEDITRRKLAEQIITDSEKRFRSLIDNSSDGLSIINADGTLLYESLASSRIVGYAHGELVSKNVFTLIHPDDFPSMMHLFAKLLKEPSTVLRAELRIQHKDGTWRWIEQTAKNCLRDPTIGGVVINFRDITERKQAEENRRRIERIVDKSQVVLFHWLPESGWPVSFVSEGISQFGYTADDFYSRRLDYAQIVYPQDLPRFGDEVKDYLESRTDRFTQEYRIVTKSGDVRWLDDRTLVIRDHAGNIEHIEGTVLDITERKQAEEALNKSHQKYQELINSIEGIVWEADAQTFQFLFVSKQAENMLGYPVEQCLNEPTFWVDHLHPDDKTWAVNFCLTSIRERKPHDFEYRMIAADGRMVWIRDIVNINEEEGQPLKLRGLMIDITERKRAEEELLLSERKYKGIFNFAPLGIYQSSLDGKFITANKALAKILGYDSPGEMMSLSIADDVYFEKGKRAALIARFEPEDSVADLELVWKKKGGTPIWIQLSAHAVKDNEGRTIHFEGFVHDITERKRAEEELYKISTAIEQTADCVVITDRDGIIQYVNPAFTEISGYSKEETLGKTLRILKSGMHPPEFYESLWKTILSGEVFRATLINKRKDGELIYEVNTITPIKDKEGNVTHFVSTAKEITEQMHAEQAMRKKEEHHKAVIESIFKFVPEGVLVLTESMNLLKHNKAFDDVVQKYAPLLGYTEEKLAEKIVEQLRSKILSGDTTEIRIPKKSE